MVAKSKRPAPLPVAVPSEPPSLKRVLPAMSLESFADLGRENMEAMAKSNLALSEGLGAIGEELFACAKTALASAGRAATALLGAKTFDELVELNSDLAKSTLEALIVRSTKLGELGIATTNQALAPFGGRLEAALASWPPGA